MLAVANLLEGEISESMSESMSLATASFDELSSKCQDSLKRSIEAFMVPLGSILLSAYHVSLALGNHEALEILQEALEAANQEIKALILRG